MDWKVINGDNTVILKTLPDNSIDAVVTDPPYGISFLGKDWDAHTGELNLYKECLRVLKPGGYLLAFSAARTYHKLATAVEEAGFEIRDQLMWIYSSGFPKAQDVGKQIDKATGKKNSLKRHDSDKKKNNGLDLGSVVKCPTCHKDSCVRYYCDKGDDCGMIYKPQSELGKVWAGWKTALKPAHEPIVMARKPINQSVAKNVQEWGTGALNIDGCRVEFDGVKDAIQTKANWAGKTSAGMGEYKKLDGTVGFGSKQLLHDQVAIDGYVSDLGRYPSNVIGEVKGYEKYFFQPKVNRKERHTGFDMDSVAQIGSTHPDDIKKHPLWDPSIGGDAARLKKKITEAGGYKGNTHPTVKPVALMEYLVKLVTPPGGTVLDPFNGSGSTGMACVKNGFSYVGVELDPQYCDISRTRIAASIACATTYNDLFEEGE